MNDDVRFILVGVLELGLCNPPNTAGKFKAYLYLFKIVKLDVSKLNSTLLHFPKNAVSCRTAVQKLITVLFVQTPQYLSANDLVSLFMFGYSTVIQVL